MIRELVQKEGFAVLTTIVDTTPTILLFLNPIEEISLERIGAFIDSSDNANVPCIAGYLSYEYLSHFQKVIAPLHDAYNIPLQRFYRYGLVVAITKDEIREHRITNETPLWSAAQSEIKKLVLELSNAWSKSTAPHRINPSQNPEFFEANSNFTRSGYIDAVLQIQELIRDGECYQVNLSQQFTIYGNVDRWELFLELLRREQPQYGALFSIGTDQLPCHIVSHSPELFFHTDDRQITVNPIKGTIARNEDLEIDEQNRNSLLASEKDLAELAMIVDLMRNDLGKISEVGSVAVKQFPTLLTLPNLYHLCCPVTATLLQGTDIFQIMKALFPSGSVTGAPKTAAMKYIAQFEDTRRGPYCGSIGWIARDSSCFNVAIRSGVAFPDRFIFQAGGAITLASDPEAEYQETIDKASGFAKIFEARG